MHQAHRAVAARVGGRDQVTVGPRRAPRRRRRSTSSGPSPGGPPRRARPARCTCTRGWFDRLAARPRPPLTNPASACTIAVVIRSAPGEPIASAEPSSWRPTVGAMLDSSRVPGGSRVQPARVELLLAEAVVEPDAGARGDHPRAVARRHRHRARGAVAVGRRDVRGRAGLQHREVVGVDQRRGMRARVRARGRRSWSSTSSRWPEHRPLHPDEVLDVVGVPLAVRPAVQQAQHRGHAPRRRPTAAESWPSVQSPTRVLSRTGGRRGGTPPGRRGPSRPPRAITSSLISRARSPVCSALGPSAAISSKRADEVGQHDQVGGELARPRRGPPRRLSSSQPKIVVVHVLEVVARRRARAGSRRGPRRSAAPRSRATAAVPIARVRLAERRQRAVRGHRSRTDRDRRPRRRTPCGCPTCRRRGAPAAGRACPSSRRRCTARRRRRLDGDEPAGAQRDDPDLVDHRHQDCGERGVDRVAAGCGRPARRRRQRPRWARRSRRRSCRHASGRASEIASAESGSSRSPSGR